MPNYDFKGDKAKAAWFQDKYDPWIVEVLKRKPILGMEPKHIKWLYQNDAIFHQWVDIIKENLSRWERVKNAVQE